MSNSNDDDGSEGSNAAETAEETGEETMPEPDTCQDLFLENDNCWLSEDHIFELQASRDQANKFPPPLKDWSELEASTKAEITVGKARRVAWDHGKEEILLHKKNVSAINDDDDDADSTSKVYNCLFGSKSKLKALFCETLDISCETYLGFILSFFKSCRYKMSVKNLHDTDDHIQNLMPTEQYNKIWRDIARAPRHAHGESFWQQVESTLNNAYKELFAEAAAADDVFFRYVIGLDDDKLHYNWTKETDSDFIKKDHHVKDNRHGFTLHTAAFSATASPLHVSAQRSSETVRLTTERMLDEIFGKHTGTAASLDNVDLAMDRGYWEAKLLFNLLAKGAHLHGTIKRMDWVPLTYDHEKWKPFPEQPKNITKSGHKDAYYMTTTWKSNVGSGTRKIACVGYRAGTGTAVSIAINTRYRKPTWDFVPKDNSTWYHDRNVSSDEKKKKAMKLLVGEDPAHACVDCLLEKMEPRTCEQGTADWFVDRQLSGTSSTIASIILSVAPTIDDSDLELKGAFETVLQYAGCNSILGSAVPESDSENDDDASSDSVDDPAIERAKAWISSLQDKDVDSDDEFIQELDDDEIDIDELRWMVSLLKGAKEKSTATLASCKNTLKKWLQLEKARRPYELLTLTSLKEMASAQGIKSTRKKDIIDELVKPAAERQPQAPGRKPKMPAAPSHLAPMVTLLKQACLRPQSNDESRTAASIGHRNEEPFLRSFYDECKKSHNDTDDFNPYDFDLDVKALYRVGLMRKKGSNFAKASLDGAAFIENDGGGIELVPVEVKSRVSSTTMTEARDRIEEEVGAELYNERRKYLLRLSSSNELVRTLLHDESNPKREKNEAFQLLHGAYVAEAKHGVMLIGSKDKLMYGMYINFEDDLLEAYQTVMEYAYKTFFSMFYESTTDDLSKSATIKEALEFVGWLDMHSFLTNYNVWRAINVDVNESNIWFPLPPCARLIPFQNSLWNVYKGVFRSSTFHCFH